MDGTVLFGQEIPASVEEKEAFTAVEGASAHSVCLKAPKTNKKVLWLAKKTKTGTDAERFPLEPGEQVTIDMKNVAQIFYKLEEATDKLAWIILGA